MAERNEIARALRRHHAGKLRRLDNRAFGRAAFPYQCERRSLTAYPALRGCPPCGDRLVSDVDHARAATLVEVTKPDHEIGRASCRERVCQHVSISGVAVS